MGFGGADDRYLNMLSVHRWTKYGKDRLYVADPAGESLGWVDLESGSATLDVPGRVAEFDRAIDRWCRTNGIGRPRPFSGGLWPRPEVHHGIDLHFHDPHSHDPRSHDPAHDAHSHDPAPGRPLTTTALAGQLRSLSRTWRVVHDLPVGDGIVEHLLIGHGGVFAIRSIHHPDRPVWVGDAVMLVDGHRSDELRHAYVQAHRVSRAVHEATGSRVEVGALLVVDADLTLRDSAGGGVHVMHVRGLERWARRRRPVLADDGVELVCRAATDPLTWQRASRSETTFSPWRAPSAAASGHRWSAPEVTPEVTPQMERPVERQRC